MARVETIVVGGGIAATAPFTTGTIPLISAAVPPALSDSIMRQTGGGIVVGTTDPGGVEKFRTVGGIVSAYPGFLGSTVIGKGAVALNNDVISIGSAAGVGATIPQAGINIGAGSLAEGSSLALGVNAYANANSGTSAHIVIGSGSRSNNGGAGADCVVIGGGLIVSGARIIAIGCNAIGGGVTASICIGISATIASIGLHDVICMGRSASVSADYGSMAFGTASVVAAGHDGAQVYGYGATSTGAGHVVWGADVAGVNHVHTFVLGGGEQTVTEDKTIRCANGSGANIVGSNLVVQAPLSTGNAVPGTIQFKCGVVGGAPGSGLQVARVSLQIKTSVTGSETDLLLYDVDNATLERVTVGSADSGGVGFKLLRIPN